MDLHIQDIQQTTNIITTNVFRKTRIKSYQRLTPDPKITRESKIKGRVKFNTTQVVHLICHGVHEILHHFITTWYLILCDLDHQWSSKILLPHRHQYLIHKQTSVHTLSQMYELNFISFSISFKTQSNNIQNPI